MSWVRFPAGTLFDPVIKNSSRMLSLLISMNELKNIKAYAAFAELRTILSKNLNISKGFLFFKIFKLCIKFFAYSKALMRIKFGATLCMRRFPPSPY